MTGMDDWHGLLAWITGMEADISYFYILITDGQTDRLTDRRTLVPLKSLSRLKRNIHVLDCEKSIVQYALYYLTLLILKQLVITFDHTSNIMKGF